MEYVKCNFIKFEIKRNTFEPTCLEYIIKYRKRVILYLNKIFTFNFKKFTQGFMLVKSRI